MPFVKRNGLNFFSVPLFFQEADAREVEASTPLFISLNSAIDIVPRFPWHYTFSFYCFVCCDLLHFLVYATGHSWHFYSTNPPLCFLGLETYPRDQGKILACLRHQRNLQNCSSQKVSTLFRRMGS